MSNNREVVEASDVIAITTQDYAITDVAQEIYGHSERLDGKLFHQRGASFIHLETP